MVFTLHRYIFRELLKVFILAAVALTLILSLGSILQPVQQQGVGPQQVMHLIVYFMPITLTFVLPMAALFACALTYGRFASDNELDACKASGVSLLTIVYPGLALAIVVATANLLLSFHVMPYFVHLAEKSLKADAKQILFRNIQRRGYYRLPPDRKTLIYADDADTKSGVLMGVVVATKGSGGIEKLISAESAKISFHSRDQFNEVRVITYNTYKVGTMDAQGFFMGRGSFSHEFGSLLGDSIKFKKVKDMKLIRADLSCFYPIARLSRETYAQLTAELLAQDIRNTMKNSPESLYRLYSGSKSVEFSATECTAQSDRKVLLSGEVMLVEKDLNGSESSRVLRCSRTDLQIDSEEQTPTLTMDIYYARVEGSDERPMRHIIKGLIVPASVEETTCTFKTQNNRLLPRALAKPVGVLGDDASSNLVQLQTNLDEDIRETLAQITSEMHSRLVFGTGCVPMILIGIGLGIIKRGGHLLTAFGASCIPAAVLIVCIMSGKNVAENLGAKNEWGIVLMWAGLGFLLLLAGGIYHRLLRN